MRGLTASWPERHTDGAQSSELTAHSSQLTAHSSTTTHRSMRKSFIVVLSVIAASNLSAQGQAGPPQGPIPVGPDAAQMLLAHTGELELTDAQVVKLAAIARRADARRRSMRASADSMRMRMESGPADSSARR